MIIAHEKGHICHYDFFWNTVRSVLIVLFWYNPFIYLAVYLSKEDAEMAADEFAVNFSGEGKHHAYAKLLVDVQNNEIEKYRNRPLSLQTDFSTQYKKTKDRIIGLYAQSTIRSQARSVRLLYSLALTLIISIVFLSSYLYADVQVDYSSSEIRATSVAGRDLNIDTIGTSAILAGEEDFAHDSMTTYTVETETSNDRLNNQEIYSIDFTIATAATAQDTEEIAVAYETRETAVAIETTRD